jgi:hypothetical protein
MVKPANFLVDYSLLNSSGQRQDQNFNATLRRKILDFLGYNQQPKLNNLTKQEIISCLRLKVIQYYLKAAAEASPLIHY